LAKPFGAKRLQASPLRAPTYGAYIHIRRGQVNPETSPRMG
jgi:hypothetical protein